jgi:hypothetical protein
MWTVREKKSKDNSIPTEILGSALPVVYSLPFFTDLTKVGAVVYVGFVLGLPGQPKSAITTEQRHKIAKSSMTETEMHVHDLTQ